MEHQAEGMGERAPPERAMVGFYHLTRTTLEEALPALLERTLESGARAVVRCEDAAQVKALDEVLWKVPPLMWLPHGYAKTGQAHRQPIWLTESDERPNEGTFLFRLNGAWDGDLVGFQRVFDLFDGRDEQAVQQARQRWKSLKQAGYGMTYWQQQAKGWAKKG